METQSDSFHPPGLRARCRDLAGAAALAVVVCLYVWRRDDLDPLDRIALPSGEGAAWIAVAALGYEPIVRVVTPLLPLIGLSHGDHAGGVAT